MKEDYVVYYKEFNPYGNNSTHWERKLIKDITKVFESEEEAKKYCDEENRRFAETSICWHEYKKVTFKEK